MHQSGFFYYVAVDQLKCILVPSEARTKKDFSVSAITCNCWRKMDNLFTFIIHLTILGFRHFMPQM